MKVEYMSKIMDSNDNIQIDLNVNTQMLIVDYDKYFPVSICYPRGECLNGEWEQYDNGFMSRQSDEVIIDFSTVLDLNWEFRRHISNFLKDVTSNPTEGIHMEFSIVEQPGEADSIAVLYFGMSIAHAGARWSLHVDFEGMHTYRKVVAPCVV